MVLLLLALTQGQVELQPGMVITHSIVVKPKTYRLSGPPIIVRGDSIMVDFRGATLQGTDLDVEPDQRRDTAIVVDGGNAIVIANAHIHGYKVGILARGTRGLALYGNDVGGNWKPRLFSGVEHESLVDWLSFHHNEKDEWLRFGAAIYLQDVSGAELRQNIAVSGMNGLLLVRTTRALIRDNNFSFNSGLGIGLYRSSDDTILHNQLDFNVRGYSHGHYTRGQDSADLLLFEQSCRNLVAFNSLTHGGDGIFLWAGQTTMDSGTGGANDNLFYGNDVSYSTANGVEATFSRNRIIGNKAWGGEYGVWGGYSYDTEIRDNDFQDNRIGIAIEHGQDNMIAGNRFTRDSTAISLWADSITPSDWGYPKYHDTRSRDYRIMGNQFTAVPTRLKIRNTTGVDSTDRDVAPTAPLRAVQRLFGDSLTIPASELSSRDRAAIIVDQWGPYDWRTPRLWPIGRDTTNGRVRFHLAVLGPRLGDRWRTYETRRVTRIETQRGALWSLGVVGDTIIVTPWDYNDWSVTLTSRSGRLTYGVFDPWIDWSVQFSSDSGFRRDTALSKLDFMWYRPPAGFRWVPQGPWSLTATGTVTLEASTRSYSLRTISDDAIRLWVDGKLVIDNWTPHESQVDYAPLAPGKHDLRVEYRQVDGWVELRVDIIRGSSRSTGSPGPH